MKNKIIRNTSLVFARRKTTSSRKKRGRSFFTLKKFLAVGLAFALGSMSLYTGHVFAKNTKIPFFLENKAPKTVLQPVVVAKEKESSIESLLVKKNIEYTEVSRATTSATIIITLEKNSFAYVDSSENMEGQVEALSNILERLRIENPGKKIAYIDLRFSRPVVKF